jgi:hypothetical protein
LAGFKLKIKKIIKKEVLPLPHKSSSLKPIFRYIITYEMKTRF